MKTRLRVILLVLLTLALAGAIALERLYRSDTSGEGAERTRQPESVGLEVTSILPRELGTNLPKLVYVGSGQCVPCRMKARMLKNLEEEFGGRFVVEFVDVDGDPSAAQGYRIDRVPTQIFYDGSGYEIDRRMGVLSRKAVLAKMEDLGVDISGEADSAGVNSAR